MLRFAARAGPVRLAFLFIFAFVLAFMLPPVANAAAQPDPAAAPMKLHVDSVEVNLTAHPVFTFAIKIPTVLRFEAIQYQGQQLLHVWAISRVDSLQARIRKATDYLDRQSSIFSPLIEPPNRMRLVVAAGSPLRGLLLANTLSRDNLAAR